MSIKNLPTLKGVFPQPKVPPKRDFLRENKIKLKELQKFAHRRSQQNDEEPTDRRLQRHRSETRISSGAQKRVGSSCSCVSKKTQSSTSSTKTLCDKGIQTDEINDEAFLSDALKRCFSKGSSEINSRGSQSELSDKLRQNSHIDFSGKYPSTERLPNQFHSAENFLRNEEHNNVEPDIPDLGTLNLDLNNYPDDDLISSNLGTLVDSSMPLKRKTKNVGTSEHRNRSDIRLPKYLEREKRERELQRLRDMEKDPHCPKDHYVLDDKDRQEALKAAEKKFQDLVNELNRMPMSSETLRTRNRKMEIEKALIELEQSIRTFSKNKVYVRSDN